MKMDELWKEIIELSDCPFIQDFAVKEHFLINLQDFDRFPIPVLDGHVYNKHWQYLYADKKRIVWMPISIRISRGNIWIDEMLIDKLRLRESEYKMLKLNNSFSVWKKAAKFDHDCSDIVLKLRWFRELIKEK